MVQSRIWRHGDAREPLPVLVAVPFVLVMSAGCSSEVRDWESAQRAHTTEAYEAFLERHPSGTMADDARARIAALSAERAWSDAQVVGTIEAYETFLQRYYDASQASSAIAAIAELVEARDWEAASQRDSMTAYEDFLRAHPDGKHKSDAETRLQQLRAASASARQPQARAGETEIPLSDLRPLFPRTIQDEPRWAQVYCFSGFPRAFATVVIRDPALPGPTSAHVSRVPAGFVVDEQKAGHDAAVSRAEASVQTGRAIVICTPVVE